MSSNRLKLNADKTEFIWLGTRQQLSKVVATPLQVRDQLLQPTDTVRDLGRQTLRDLGVLIDRLSEANKQNTRNHHNRTYL